MALLRVSSLISINASKRWKRCKVWHLKTHLWVSRLSLSHQRSLIRKVWNLERSKSQRHRLLEWNPRCRVVLAIMTTLIPLEISEAIQVEDRSVINNPLMAQVVINLFWIHICLAILSKHNLKIHLSRVWRHKTHYQLVVNISSLSNLITQDSRILRIHSLKTSIKIKVNQTRKVGPLSKSNSTNIQIQSMNSYHMKDLTAFRIRTRKAIFLK